MTASVILVSPKGSGNVGSIARLMANFSVRDLRIVSPRCELLDDEARMMSLKALPILQEAKIFETLQEAQQDLNASYAFSMIHGDDGRRILDVGEFFNSDYKNSFSSPQFQYGFVFGREESGLTREEIRLCDAQIFIPASDDYPSLNLSQAVGICLFLHSQLKASAVVRTEPEESPPKKEHEEIFFEGLEKALEELKFFSSQEPAHVMGNLRNFYHRARPSDRELRILFGIVAELEYRLGKKFFR